MILWSKSHVGARVVLSVMFCATENWNDCFKIFKKWIFFKNFSAPHNDGWFREQVLWCMLWWLVLDTSAHSYFLFLPFVCIRVEQRSHHSDWSFLSLLTYPKFSKWKCSMKKFIYLVFEFLQEIKRPSFSVLTYNIYLLHKSRQNNKYNLFSIWISIL